MAPASTTCTRQLSSATAADCVLTLVGYRLSTRHEGRVIAVAVVIVPRRPIKWLQLTLYGASF